MIKTFNLLTKDEIAFLKDRLFSNGFMDGKATAKSEYLSKQNEQVLISKESEVYDWLLVKLFDHPYLKTLVRPKALVRPMLNKYQVGDFYGWHYDAPTMGEYRGDVSFTLFLENSDVYEGGELQLKDGEKTIQAKLEAGDIIIYSTGHLHQVMKVTKGVRVCIVGWIESWIKDESVREDLTQLARIIGEMRVANEDDLRVQQLAGIYNNMIRRESV